MSRHQSQFPACNARRGAAYVMVMTISLLVSVIGVAALTAVRVQIRTASNSNDCEEARSYAQSGLELARNWINSDSSWRTNRTSGSTATLSFGAGSFAISMVDPVDNDFTNSPLDPVKITAVGYKGRAQQQLQVMLTPTPAGYSCLNAAIFSGGSLTVNTGRITATGASVATNSNMAVTGTLDANAEATGSFAGTSYLGSKTSGVAARRLPDGSAFDYYVRNGTAIPYASIGGADLNGVLLSPANNPFGTPDPNGIYVIDCGGNTIRVKNCRIVGTLVILNCKNDSTIDNQVNFAPAVANLPTLMVKGTITFQFNTNTLAEAAGKNFNPPGAPYNGVSNTTTTDTYPSIINGLVYVSGNLIMKNNNALGGPLIVGGGLFSDNTITTTYDATYLTNPPPGFFDPPPMKPSSSSWAQTVN